MMKGQIPFACWSLDSLLNVEECNDQAKVLGSDPFSLLDSENATKLKAWIKTDIESIALPFNKHFYLQWHKTINEMKGFDLIAVDVTKVKESSENFFKQILNATPDLVFVKGEKSKLLWTNKAFQDYYEMTAEELQETIDAPHVEPDITQQYVIDDSWVWKNKKTLLIDCEPVTRPNGEIRKFQTLKAPLLDSAGTVLRMIGISRDITEKIESEERSTSNAKMAALGEMAGGIAHEINNPLAIICGKVRQLRRVLVKREKEISSEDLEKYIGAIEDCSLRITKIVNGLRRFSRDGDNDPFELVQLKTVIDTTLSFCAARMSYHGIDLKVDIDDSIELECMDVQLSQILLNLLNNAVDAVDGLIDPWVSISSRVDGDFLELRVEDSGPGVPEEIVTKIMQPFFTTKDIGKGTGLGLSLSLSIAKDHGGFLKLDRKKSMSCFLLKIPLKHKKAK